MSVLLMGFRSGAARNLEEMNIDYIIWSEKELINPRRSQKVIISRFPEKIEDLNGYLEEFSSITHVIASTESAVIPASKIRRWLDLYRNKDSVISRCTDKLEMKKYLSKKNIPMTKFLPSRGMKSEQIVEKLGLPVVSKIRLSSGGRGVRFLTTEEEVKTSMNSDSYFEKALKGTEGSIESFIKDGEIFFSNITQYYKNGECNILPGQYEKKIKERINSLNFEVIKALNIKWGMTHLEYYILEGGEIVFGEVALRPPGGYIMDALDLAYGQNFWKLFLQVEMNIEDLKLEVKENNSCSIIIHPGEGVVSSILGVENIKNLKSLKKFKLKIKVGDQVQSREGVGEDYGHALLSNTNSRELLDDINKFYKLLEISL
ncbi:acetyl-CoA carboxylase biotin carboxylase subunit family protein [Halobacteriovorax sp.]|uniref:ATP-grasp domain-containing protein n=1 Tax=Halobacteriovorax sp. TaxID=2020862 RepID=UPI00356619BD